MTPEAMPIAAEAIQDQRASLTVRLDLPEVGRLAEILGKHRAIDLSDGSVEGWIRYHLDRDAQSLGFIGSADQKHVPISRLNHSNVWETAVRIREVHEGKLYRSTHQSFEAWCDSIGVTSNHARHLIRIATEFSRDEVVEIGATKLTLILRIESGMQRAESRSALLERARRSSVKELNRYGSETRRMAA